MSVGLVIVTHGAAGKALIEVAEFILSEPLTGVREISFSQSVVYSTGDQELHNAMQQCDQGQGVLVLTDLVGASPANRVSALLEEFNGIMVSGLNLAMLLRVWNYRHEPIDKLAKKAVNGGKRGIEVVRP